jgi:hypothetical protein
VTFGPPLVNGLVWLTAWSAELQHSPEEEFRVEALEFRRSPHPLFLLKTEPLPTLPNPTSSSSIASSCWNLLRGFKKATTIGDTAKPCLACLLYLLYVTYIVAVTTCI